MILARGVLDLIEHFPVPPPDDVLGMSLWDADDKPLWHRCFNCYSKSIVFALDDALTVGAYVRDNFWKAVRQKKKFLIQKAV